MVMHLYLSIFLRPHYPSLCFLNIARRTKEDFVSLIIKIRTLVNIGKIRMEKLRGTPITTRGLRERLLCPSHVDVCVCSSLSTGGPLSVDGQCRHALCKAL